MSAGPWPADNDRARELREKLMPLLKHVADIVAEAQSEGLRVNFAVNVDGFGQSRPTIEVVRVL